MIALWEKGRSLERFRGADRPRVAAVGRLPGGRAADCGRHRRARGLRVRGDRRSPAGGRAPPGGGRHDRQRLPLVRGRRGPHPHAHRPAQPEQGRRGAPGRRHGSGPAHAAAHPGDGGRLVRGGPGRRRRHRRAAREDQGAGVMAQRPASAERAREQDRELLQRYHNEGDTGAREQLIQRHLPLVRSLARRYAGRGAALEDIEQVGAIGLIKAIDRFELDREVSLATYATPNVVGEIKRHFRDKGWAIRVPRALQELNAKMSSGIERLTLKLSRSPSIAEIAEELETTPEHVLEAMEVGSAYSTVSLSSGPAGEEELDPLETIGEEDEGFARSEHRAALAPALERLPAREREILRMRFEEGLPQTQIAQRVGLSQMHVSRLIRKSLSIMREELLRTPPGAA